MKGDFNIDDLRIKDSDLPPSPVGVLGSNRCRRYRPKQFIMVPMVWVDRLKGARVTATYRVALHLLFRSFKDRRDTIRLANGAMALEGVTPDQKWRALQELERLELVSIDNRARKSPDITLLYPSEER